MPSNLVMWSRPALSLNFRLHLTRRHAVSLVQINGLDRVRVGPPFVLPRVDDLGRRLDLQEGSPWNVMSFRRRATNMY